jgi:anti-anti-sigma regulatory factor
MAPPQSLASGREQADLRFGVDQIDADAALVLVRCFFTARGSGGELRFAAARPDVVRPFRATTLDTLLPFDPTVTAACEHFRAGCPPVG